MSVGFNDPGCGCCECDSNSLRRIAEALERIAYKLENSNDKENNEERDGEIIKTYVEKTIRVRKD